MKKTAIGSGTQGHSKISTTNSLDSLRIDKWLWCARFFKTRSLAADTIAKGHITINGQVAKASRELRCGDTVVLRQGPIARTVIVLILSGARGSTPIAQQLYEETTASIQAREQATEQRRLAPEPANTLTKGRPTKRDRRNIERVNTWDDFSGN
jgi:ribosome-associated heat shock protein Hsp15